jgi:hypothetical protein
MNRGVRKQSGTGSIDTDLRRRFLVADAGDCKCHVQLVGVHRHTLPDRAD